jgi:hypothetical protein
MRWDLPVRALPGLTFRTPMNVESDDARASFHKQTCMREDTTGISDRFGNVPLTVHIVSWRMDDALALQKSQRRCMQVLLSLHGV